MSIWEKVYKNPKGAALLKDSSLQVPDIKLPKRGYQLPSLHMGLALGTTYTKRSAFCQIGNEFMPLNSEDERAKQDLSVFRVEKVISDIDHEVALGEEALGHFMSDRGDPACTLFFQPNRFLLAGTKLASFVTSYDGQKVLFQSPSNDEVFKHFIRAQYEYLWNASKSYFSEIRRFQLGQVVVEYPDYFSEPDLQKYRNWFVEAAEDFFPPLLDSEEEHVEMKDKFIFLPESLITLLHWLTDNVEAKLASQELDLKKLLAQRGILPRITDQLSFLVVTMGGTHSRVVRINVDSISELASAKRVGEAISVYHSYLGRTGLGGDHVSCSFLEEEEEKRYGATSAHKVNTLTRKVFEDWEKMTTVEGKKHFEELYGDEFNKAIEKLGDLTIKGFSETPENSLIVLGGKVFEHSYFRDNFKKHLSKNRVPMARVVSPSKGEISISRVCEILQFSQKGLGRSFTLRSSLDAESGSRMTWKIGKVVEGALVDTLVEPDNKMWDKDHPREFTISFAQGVRRMNLGYQKTADGISQLWANVTVNTRVITPLQVTFKTEGVSDLQITNISSEKETKITEENFQIDMLIAGEHPSHYPLYDKLLKN